MVAFIDRRIDCPMLAWISGEEYHTTLVTFDYICPVEDGLIMIAVKLNKKYIKIRFN
ncbi:MULTISPECIES: hypothetical protein [Bacteroides]|uniref:hypothetical protein n=1 Tax=Bacteroides TaxID=816 RepID=UPI002030D75A|nr:hypothetical protein [Bacteroides ovatus]MCM1721560.1 hypothetical protein [Bacteroides ovatus]MCM1866859.1 hypothetical protein [Bacteroides ovatus]